MVNHRNTPVEDLIRSQVQSKEKFTDQRSSHLKLCTPVRESSLNIGEGGPEGNAAKYPQKLVAPQCVSQKSQVLPLKIKKK